MLENIDNLGDNNLGDNNVGEYNTGNYNAGCWNVGESNSGDYNSGDNNLGTYNTGDFNHGHCNTGDGNIGAKNSGNWNYGHHNSGNWNTGKYNTGFFNTGVQTVRMFNKDTGLTYSELIENYEFPSFLYFKATVWVSANDATEKEKQEHSKEISIIGGFLKKLSYKEAFRQAWDSANVQEHAKLLKLPNWDNDIFKEISGIDAEAEIAKELAILETKD